VKNEIPRTCECCEAPNPDGFCVQDFQHPEGDIRLCRKCFRDALLWAAKQARAAKPMAFKGMTLVFDPSLDGGG
jgi:hypothetical protein